MGYEYVRLKKNGRQAEAECLLQKMKYVKEGIDTVRPSIFPIVTPPPTSCRGIQVNGVDQYVSFPSDNFPLTNNSGGTGANLIIDCGVIPGEMNTDPGQYKTIYEKLNDNFGLYVRNPIGTGTDSGYTFYGITTGGSIDMSSQEPVGSGYSRVIVVFNGNNAYLYVNGVLKNTQAATGTFTIDALGSVVGGGSGDSNFAGKIDFVRVYTFQFPSESFQFANLQTVITSAANTPCPDALSAPFSSLTMLREWKYEDDYVETVVADNGTQNNGVTFTDI